MLLQAIERVAATLLHNALRDEMTFFNRF